MAESIQWRDNLTEALAEAQKAQRLVLLEFYLDGWPHCGRLVRETYQDPAVIAALNDKYIPVHLEGRSHMDDVRKYGVRGAPTTLLFSPDGQEKHRFVGFLAAPEYLKELEKAA